MDGTFSVTFRGVRGSYPVPGNTTQRVGGNTPCVEVHAGGHTIILDAGTGIIGLGAQLVRTYFSKPAGERGRLVVTVLLSHMHHDHIQGYPFFAPLYLEQTKAFVYGPRMLREDLSGVLSGAMVAPYFPVDAESLACERVIRNISETDVVVFDPVEESREPRVERALASHPGPGHVVIRSYHCLAHPRGGSFCYRIEFDHKRIVYATDVEGYVGGDRRLIKFAENADLLIHDVQYRTSEYTDGGKQGWGHSTAEMAADVARAAGVKRLAMFHHAPTNDDDTVDLMEREAQALFPETFAAREGLSLTL